MTRREFAMAAGAVSLTGIGLSARTRASDTKTLRFIAQSDLRVLDPIWTTAGITRDHGYMVYDTPFALDAKFKPQPQMVGDYSISPDKLLYSFTLRDGLKFHDGEPVRATDCVVSLQRWMVRDSFGQSLATAVDKIETAGDKSFTIGLKEPFPLLLDALAKVAGPPFIMPERLARTDPYQQVTEAVGSGPYKFVKEEFQPGHMAVYVKNTDYVPRSALHFRLLPIYQRPRRFAAKFEAFVLLPLPAHQTLRYHCGSGGLRSVPPRVAPAGYRTCPARTPPRRRPLPNCATTQRCSTPVAPRRDRHPGLD